MNFTFMIDNCLSSCQRSYNGLSTLDYAKNATEYLIKKRLKSGDSKYDCYHLYSCNGPLSTWVHDIGHLLQTLKTIQPTLEQGFCLEECFHNLNRFRVLNGTDNLYGGRDILKIESSVVFLFTNRDGGKINMNLPLRWDQKLIVFHFQLPGLEENAFIPNESGWHGIAQESGCGQCFQITQYQELFRILDEIQLQPQVCLRLHSSNININYDELSKYIEKNKRDEKQQNWLVKSQQKLNLQFASLRLKQAANMTIFTRVYLPEQYLISDFNQYPSYPEYYVDFSINLQFKLQQYIPYQEVPIENAELLAYVQSIQTIRKNFIQFPLIFIEKREEQSIPVLIGFLVYSNQSLELRFYFPNFYIFADIFQQFLSNSANKRLTEQKFLLYLSTIPNYYSPCIKKILQDHNINIQRQLTFLLDETTHSNYMSKVKQFQTIKQKIKKTIDEENQKNRIYHIQKKSICCAAYSENYEMRFQEQINCDYRTHTFIQKPYHFRQMQPNLNCQSCLPQMPNSGWPPLRNTKSEPEEIEIRLEGAFCGNPWKLFRKSYRDGVEIKNEQEEQQVEDMMLTRVDSVTQQQTKNRRKGFMRLKDINDCNHKQSNLDDGQTMEQEIESISQEQEKTMRIRYNPQFQVRITQNRLNTNYKSKIF